MSYNLEVRYQFLFTILIPFLPLFSMQALGPYDVIWKEVKECNELGNGDFLFINPKFSRQTRTQVAFVTNLTLNRDLIDTMGFHATSEVWGNGGWKPNFITQSFPSFCQYLDGICADVKKIYAACGVERCPIPKKTCQVDIPLNNIRPDIPSFLYGKYKVNIKLTEKDVVLGCIEFILEVVQKKRKG